MRRAAAILLTWLILCMANSAGADSAITEKAQLNRQGIRVGVSTGSASVLVVKKELPNAKIVYFEDDALAYQAVAQGKIDAYIYGRRQMQQAIDSGRRGVHLLDENMDEAVQIGIGISPRSAIPDLKAKVNAFLAEMKADGTLEDMNHRWLEAGDETMPDIELPKQPRYRLKVGTAGVVPPFSYYVGKKLSGYDIEMAYRFAAWLDADLTFKVYDFGAIISAAASGDVDCIMSHLNITPERTEALPFSDVVLEEPIGIMVRGDAQTGATAAAQTPADRQDGAAEPSGGYIALDQLDGRLIGVQTGTTAGGIALERLPNIELSYFSNTTDMAVALETGKIDGFVCDGLVMLQMMRENPNIRMLDERLNTYECGFVLAKSERGRALCAEMNAWLKDMRERGELDRLLKKWTEGPESERTMPDYRSLPAPKGTLTLTTEGTYPPMDYYRGEECVGMDVELCALFCEACGYGLNVTTMEFEGMLLAVQTGKVDIAASGIAITEERKQSVCFSDPYFTGGMRMAVLNDQASAGAAPSEGEGEIRKSFLQTVSDSFEKTFVREGRWRLFARGVLTTLIITVLSIFCGTALGFLVYMLCRNGNPVANAVTRFCLWLVQGMPMVVLLMILYYIIFGRVTISGIIVAVFGFTLTFGAAVFGLLKMGVGAVDGGQYEAAYALGYSNRRTFFRIILPQALPHVLPAYRGEIVGLIKATAVVGYIAVQDLTKMGDIVRSRTYEAFFPLIAVTVIYFVLEGIFKRVVDRIAVRFDPRRRRPEDILKGVRTDDQN